MAFKMLLLAYKKQKGKNKAQYEQRLIGDFDEIVNLIEDGIKNGSISATLEGGAIFLQAIADALFVYLNDIVIWEEINLV